jgi:cyclopropane fatty-acyl-phospholipid synthase-like methyltransferase
LAPTDHLVEVGSGWGGLAVHAAVNFGCRVTTTTISEAQRSYVERRVADAGLSDRITVLGRDWRDLTGRYDKLVSVEMIEAVDWRWHDRFLARCSDLLTDDGLAAIQAIVIDDRSFERAKRHDDFVRRMVFPGGCLPSVASLTTSLAGPPTCAWWTWRMSAATTPRRCGVGRTTWPGTPRRSRPSGSARSSAVCGTCIWPTARRRSSNATSATSSWSWPSRAGPHD